MHVVVHAYRKFAAQIGVQKSADPNDAVKASALYCTAISPGDWPFTMPVGGWVGRWCASGNYPLTKAASK